MSFVMKVFASLDIVSLATIIVYPIISCVTVPFSKIEKFFERVLAVAVFVFPGSIMGTCLTWIWGW